MRAVTAGDESRHEPGPGVLWHEAFALDFSRDDGTGGSVRLDLYPNQGIAWYWAHVVTPERGPVAVRDHEVPMPRGDAFLARADSLWSDLVCETPMEHWSIGLEAFGVRLDAPGDAYRGEMGERLPVGLDLEWEAYTPACSRAEPGDPSGVQYAQAGIVHGEVLLGAERIAFEGRGERTHEWGERDWWTSGWHRSSFQVGDGLAVDVALAEDTGDVTGFVWRAGDELRPTTRMLLETHLGPDAIPTAARLVIDDELEVDVEVVGAAPVPLLAPDGRTARLPRALCRFETVEGTGTGWGEWLQVGRQDP